MMLQFNQDVGESCARGTFAVPSTSPRARTATIVVEGSRILRLWNIRSSIITFSNLCRSSPIIVTEAVETYVVRLFVRFTARRRFSSFRCQSALRVLLTAVKRSKSRFC